MLMWKLDPDYVKTYQYCQNVDGLKLDPDYVKNYQ